MMPSTVGSALVFNWMKVSVPLVNQLIWPGAVNPAHTHAKSALIYATVLEGAVLNQLNGGPVRTFSKGQNFTELPGDRHDVSANASQTEPAKLLAVFVVDTDDTVLTTPLAR